MGVSLISGSAVLCWLHVILLATAFSSQNVNEQDVNEPALGALSPLAATTNMLPVGVQPHIHGGTMSLDFSLGMLLHK